MDLKKCGDFEGCPSNEQLAEEVLAQHERYYTDPTSFANIFILADADRDNFSKHILTYQYQEALAKASRILEGDRQPVCNGPYVKEYVGGLLCKALCSRPYLIGPREITDTLGE